MSDSFKTNVLIDRVEPSGGNPRRDFGDIGRLAESIRATGGQPVNPIVCVLDGDKYRIVDGERRWRALKELGAETADVVVFRGYGEAEEAVAAMATDDKRQLSDAERARGFQRMLLLGVGDERAGAAAGLAPEAVRRARRVKAPVPEQATLDALIAASEFDDEEAQAAVLASHYPEATAEGLRRDRKAAAKRAALLEEIAAACPQAEEREGEAPSGWSEEGRRLRLVAVVRSKTAARGLAGHEGPLYLYADGSGWGAYAPRGEADPEAAERERVADLRARSKAACEGLLAGMVCLVDDRCAGDALRRAAEAARRPVVPTYAEGDLGEEAVAAARRIAETSVAGDLEAARLLVDVFDRTRAAGLRDWDGSLSRDACGRVAPLAAAARADGWADELPDLAAVEAELAEWRAQLPAEGEEEES